MDLQKEEQKNNLYVIVKDLIPSYVLKRKNASKSLVYGYNEKYDMVIISKDGTVGDIYNINGLYIGIPKEPTHIYKRSSSRADQ